MIYPIDETGKYKTGKCSVDFFVQTAFKFGIELSHDSIQAIKDRAIPGSHEVLQYVPIVKELSLKINTPDENQSSKGRL